MKKIISLLVAALMLTSIITVSADSYNEKVYTFTNVNSTATFDAEGEAVSIDNEAILRFDANKVNMTLAGDADNAMLQQVILTKYDNSEITYTLNSPTKLKAIVFRNGNFEPIEIEQGAYLLVLSTLDERGSAVVLLVGEQNVMTEDTVPTKPASPFGENATISDWAITETSEAYDLSLITVELYKNANYKRNITRGEFAHVMAQVLIQCGADYDAYVKGLGSNPTFKFSDTNGDLEIEFVSSCGVINGMSETEFAPQNELTREQAAAMLTRTVNFLGTKPIIESVTAFVDESEFSDWAKDSIYTVAGLIAAKRLLRAVK